MRSSGPLAMGLAILASAAFAGSTPQADRSGIMPVSELRAGMRGYGLTVFEGDAPTTFGVEIIGIRHNGIGAGVDLIMVRLEHPLLEDIGVVAGMSGSPVFIDDRLVGAVGYGYSFAKVAIGGVAPAEKMLDVYERTEREPPPRDIALGPVEPIRFGEPVSWEPKGGLFDARPVVIRREELPAVARALFDADEEEIELQALRAPLIASACSPVTARLIERIFKPMGLEPVFAPAGAAAGAAERVAPDAIRNGSAMGIPFLLGDLSLGTIGTATYVRDGKLVAFGHPMMGRGPVEFPLGTARILTILPSVMRPLKLGEITGLAGSIYQDRQAAVGGVVGKIPFMVPVTVRVRHETNDTEHTFKYRVMDHRLYAPRMASVGVVEACTAAERAAGEQTATIKYRIETDDGRVIEKSTMAAGTGAPVSLATALLSDLAPIYSNAFAVRSARKITAEVELRDGIESAELSSAFVNRSVVKPGQSLRVSAYVKPWRKPQTRVATTLRVPPDLDEGRYNVVVADARQRQAAALVRAPGLYKPEDFAGLVRLIDMHFPPNQLYVFITSTERGVTIDGREFASLPPGVQFTLGQLNDQEEITQTLGEIVAETTLSLPYVVSGSDITQIQVDRRGGR